jgi:hypothetical protein
VPQLYTNAFPHRGPVQVSVVVDPVAAVYASRSDKEAVTFGSLNLRLRFALFDPCDLGLMAGYLLGSMDAKCTLWSNEHHAVALDLGTLVNLGPYVWLNSAALYTYRHPSWFAVTFNTGANYWTREKYLPALLSNLPTFDARGPYVHAGISFETPGWFSIQPEFNVFRQVGTGDRITFMTFGIGFHFNHQRVTPPQPPLNTHTAEVNR